jgi:ATPase components of ABC transporters with duplicated ATPase domains
MAEFIYTMKKARKAHGDKVILDDVTIMFYPGAKIGVVGPNGAGKSTVLQIMAGLQQPSNGEAYLTPGYTVGILLQEPQLNESKMLLITSKRRCRTVACLRALMRSARDANQMQTMTPCS